MDGMYQWQIQPHATEYYHVSVNPIQRKLENKDRKFTRNNHCFHFDHSTVVTVLSPHNTTL